MPRRPPPFRPSGGPSRRTSRARVSLRGPERPRARLPRSHARLRAPRRPSHRVRDHAPHREGEADEGGGRGRRLLRRGRARLRHARPRQGGGDRRRSGGLHEVHARGRHPRAARGDREEARGRRHGGPDRRADDGRRRRQERALRRDHRAVRGGRRGRPVRPLLALVPGDGREHRREDRRRRDGGRRQLRHRPGALRRRGDAAHEGRRPQLAGQPHGDRPARRGAARDRAHRGEARHRRHLGRDLRAARLRPGALHVVRAPLPRGPRPDADRERRLEGLLDDRLAHRLRRAARAT